MYPFCEIARSGIFQNLLYAFNNGIYLNKEEKDD